MPQARSEHAVQIAILGVEEWPEFKALRLEALQREPAAFNTTYEQAVAWPDEAWRERLANPRCVTLMARVGSHPIGMAGACRGDDDDERVGIIISMYVNARFRRRGVGRRLLAAAIDYLRGFPEIETIRLWVSPTHLPARRLYESLGFRLAGEPGKAGSEGTESDLLIMERPAESPHPNRDPLRGCPASALGEGSGDARSVGAGG